MSAPFSIAYAAHTSACTFLLDADGVCRRIVHHTSGLLSAEPVARCIGAQYVASLVISEKGLVEMPEPGAPMLFARVDDNGRVSLVRTAPLDRFEVKDPPELDQDPHDPLERTQPEPRALLDDTDTEPGRSERPAEAEPPFDEHAKTDESPAVRPGAERPAEGLTPSCPKIAGAPLSRPPPYRRVLSPPPGSLPALRPIEAPVLLTRTLGGTRRR